MAATKPGKGLPALDASGVDEKTEFFLTASHQLKSPVAIIQWCLQSLMELQEMPADQRKLVSRALDQANGMSRLLQDMLQVFRVLHPREALQLGPVSCNAALEEILTQYEPVAHTKGVHLVRGPIEMLPTVLAKDTYVREIIRNLVDNAVKYTPAGRRVTVSAKVQKRMVEIVVADEGIGIPETERGKMFTEFFRGTEAQETASGSGLGLTLVRQMVRRLRGTVSFESEYRKGTVFTVRLPFS